MITYDFSMFNQYRGSTMPIAKYLAEVNKRFRTGISREHSYRGDLQTLIESLVTGIIATNEPARINCGAPDYVITKNNIPLGYVCRSFE